MDNAGPGPATPGSSYGCDDDPGDDELFLGRRGWPRIRPALESWALMSALYASTACLSCARENAKPKTARQFYRIRNCARGRRLTRIQSGRRAPQPRQRILSRMHVWHESP
jgi:hypothetical protein